MQKNVLVLFDPKKCMFLVWPCQTYFYDTVSCDDCTVMVEKIIIMHVQMASEACLSQCVDIMIIVLIRDAPPYQIRSFFNIV